MREDFYYYRSWQRLGSSRTGAVKPSLHGSEVRFGSVRLGSDSIPLDVENSILQIQFLTFTHGVGEDPSERIQWIRVKEYNGWVLVSLE